VNDCIRTQLARFESQLNSERVTAKRDFDVARHRLAAVEASLAMVREALDRRKYEQLEAIGE